MGTAAARTSGADHIEAAGGSTGAVHIEAVVVRIVAAVRTDIGAVRIVHTGAVLRTVVVLHTGFGVVGCSCLDCLLPS